MRSGFIQLEEAIKEEEEREHQFSIVSKEVTNLTHEISQINTKISGYQRQVRGLEQEIQTVTDRLSKRNSEHEKLAELQDKLGTAVIEADTKKDELINCAFVSDLLKDGGVKTQIIKKYLPLILSLIHISEPTRQP